MVGFNSLTLALVMPLLAIESAMIAAKYNIGMFHWLELPLWLTIPLSVVLLDAAIYFQHLVFHRVPLLWRLHRMHHADRDIDVTTGARFHPIEIVLSMWIKVAIVMLLGAPAWCLGI
ncbi:possible sterol desaturase [Vibrio maritimus]|uniref:Possible sterol desaturase n=1 Tax=Vibrio maritimus TaxID=990268 RepID=A0A090S3W1_9VIBR|nr:possible sterol desaturase [Vibrio maritimus]